MTHTDFNQILSSIKALSPEQARQLRQQLNRQIAQPKKPTAPTAWQGRQTRARPRRRSPRSRSHPAGWTNTCFSIGLLSQLPDTAADYDDPDDEPITIKGEPLSETVIRERR